MNQSQPSQAPQTVARSSLPLAYQTELAALIEKIGEEELQAQVMCQILEGKSPRQVAEEMGVRYSLLWTWLSEDDDRFTAYKAALTGFADDLAHGTLNIADNPSENAASDKLRVETRLKLASKWDRQRYGDQTNLQVSGSVSLISLLASLPRGTEAIEGELAENNNNKPNIDPLPEQITQLSNSAAPPDANS